MGDTILERLRRGELPQMVDWFDPALLVRIGVRDIISNTMGQYADQRLMQATSDRLSGKDLGEQEKGLVGRYDYSNLNAADPDKRMRPDPGGGIWVDYIADLGDGFEPTYAMAYLLAPEVLEVPDPRRDQGVYALTAGELLIMGGDQAYPQATRLDYEQRFIEPYDAAFTVNPPDKPQRKLFALPGNHDWYDGLNAFDGVFCSARDRISGGIGRAIGGWRCMQHRSYFAIKLPHDWWIWGADIQLEGYLDDAQRDYFDLVSESMGENDKVIICLAEPSWLHQEYENLHEVNMLARQSGAKVCAILAGDWHHYSRYYSPDLGVHFITCGGGGAFAHATHSLQNTITLKWARLTGAEHPVADPADSEQFSKIEKQVLGESAAADFTEQTYQISAEGGQPPAPQAGMFTLRRRERSRPKISTEGYLCSSPAIYPSKMRSRLLSLKNLLFPFHHFKFALALGAIYFLFSWVAFGIYAGNRTFYESEVLNVPAASDFIGFLDWVVTPVAGKEAGPPTTTAAAPRGGPKRDARSDAAPTAVAATGTAAKEPSPKGSVFEQTMMFILYASIDSPLFFLMIAALWLGLIYYVDVGNYKNKPIAGLFKLSLGTAHFLMHVLAIGALSIFINVTIAALAGFHNFLTGGHTIEMAFSGTEYDLLFSKYRLIGPLILIPIGGIIGGLIWGAYWALTCGLLSMHTGEAFGALGLRDYKHFLRMRFEPDQVTIYPVALHRVPGRFGWREPSAQEAAYSDRSKLVPARPLKPRLIEPPIVIRAADIKA